jgi:hypothetical protein
MEDGCVSQRRVRAQAARIVSRTHKLFATDISSPYYFPINDLTIN